jgi:methionyl-tRNA formyltransferase
LPSSCASRPDPGFLRLVFAGTTAFAERSLAALLDAGHAVALVLTQPDRPAGRGLRPAASPVKRLALARGLELFQPETLRSPDAGARIAAARPEVLVVTAYGLILPQAVLDYARLGAINVHASLLPRWRGAAPIQRALLAGDRETGVSIMRMDAGLDTGPVLAQRRVAIAAEDDAASLEERLAALGAELLLATLGELQAGRASPQPQPDEGISYARKIDKAETVLDWSRSAAQLARAVRAFRPAPGASTTLEGEALKIWRARAVEGRGTAGELLAARADALLIACGEGALEVTELQRAGGRRLGAAEFLRGRRLAPGARFGARQP